MDKQERLSIESVVEDGFTDPLKRFEKALGSADDKIDETGKGRDKIRVDVEVTGVWESIAKIQALETAIDGLNDVDVDVGDGVVADGPGASSGGGAVAMTSGGREQQLFDDSNIEDIQGILKPFYDRNEFVRRGGELTSPMDALDRDIEEVVDMRGITRAINDPDSRIGSGTLRDFMHPPNMGAFEDAVDALDSEGLTLLGDDSTKKNLDRFTNNVKRLRFSMGTFHDIIASLIPLLGIYVGAIPAAIVGVGALATAAIGAAAALAGIGALGLGGLMLMETGELNTQPLKERLSDFVDDAINAFGPLMQEFAPLADQMFTDFSLMMGPLADASAGLRQFTDEFQGAVGFIEGALPSFTNELLAFSHAVMPTLSGFVGFLSDLDFFGYLATQLSDMMPMLVMFGVGLEYILPAIINLSQGFLAVASVLTLFIGGLMGLINYFPMVAKGIGVIISSMFILLTVTSLYTVANQGLVASTLGLAKTLLVDAAVALNAHIANLIGVSAASWAAYAATAAFVGILTFGLAPILSSVVSGMSLFGTETAKTRRELEKLASMQGSLGEFGMGTGGSTSAAGGTSFRDNSTTVIYADGRDSAARQQYSSSYERNQHIDSVFGG